LSEKSATFRDHALITTILITLTTFPSAFKPITAFATIFKALAALLTLAAYETLAESVAITALVEARTIPTVEVETERDLFDLFLRQRDVGQSAQRNCRCAIGYQGRSRQNGYRRCAGQKQAKHVVLLGCATYGVRVARNLERLIPAPLAWVVVGNEGKGAGARLVGARTSTPNLKLGF